MGGGGVLTLLPRRSGRAHAAELVFTGRFLDADEAAEWGLVNRVVDDDALLAAGAELVAGFATKSPLAMANAKDVMMSLWADNGNVDAGLRYERERNSYYCLTSDDAVEGLAAFAEKRPPEIPRVVTTPVPIPDADSEPYLDALRRHELVLQHCTSSRGCGSRPCLHAHGAAAPSPSGGRCPDEGASTRGSASSAP